MSDIQTTPIHPLDFPEVELEGREDMIRDQAVSQDLIRAETTLTIQDPAVLDDLPIFKMTTQAPIVVQMLSIARSLRA